MPLRSCSGALRLAGAAVAVVALSTGISGLSFASSGPRGEQPATTTDATTIPTTAQGAPGQDGQGTDDHGSAGQGADGRAGHTPNGPKLGKDVVVTPAKGVVNVRAAGSAAWHALKSGNALPVGSVVDARHGRISLRSAVDTSGTSQTGTFWGGVFEVRQGTDGATVLVLGGPRPACSPRAPRGSSAAAAAVRRRAGAGLWGHDHGGRFRTRGRNSVATVRGTTWFVQERCGGTYTKVTHGAVLVRDAARHRTIVLRAGQSYLARPAHRRTRS